MATVKFPSEMPLASNIAGGDKLMISKEANGEAYQATFDQAKTYLNITGIELEPLEGGDDSASSTVVPAGPTGENRKAEASPGWYNFGSGPVEATADKRWTAFWNGTSWSLVDMGSLPQQDISNLATKEEVSEKAGTIPLVGKNKFNSAVVTNSKYQTSTGNMFDSDLYDLSELIPIDNDVNYITKSTTGNRGSRYRCAFDENMVAIPSQGVNSLSSSFNYTESTGVKYVSLSIYKEDVADFQVEKGTQATPFEPYFETKQLAEDVRTDWNRVITENHKVKADQVDFVKKSDNRYDKNGEGILINRFIVATTGNPSTPSGQYTYNTTPYVDVFGLSEITVNFTHQIAFYNADKVYISGVTLPRSYNITSIPVPNGAFFARQGVEPTFQEEFMMIAGDYMPVNYLPFGVVLDTNKILIPKSDEDQDFSKDIFVLESITGQESDITSSVLLDEGSLTLLNSARHIKKNVSVSARAEFNVFTGNIKVGKGLGKYRGMYIEVSDTEITCRFQNNASSTQVIGVVAHGLSISTFLNVAMFLDNSSIIHVSIGSLNGLFTTTFEPTRTGNKGLKYEWNYEPFIQSSGQDLTLAKITSGCQDFQNPLWIFADSYGGVALNRWTGQLRNLGFFNIMIDALAGITSTLAVEELTRALNFGTPKFLVWALGMNDTSLTAYTNSFGDVVNLCNQRGIQFIPCTIPSVPSRNNETKNDYVRNSGHRYIDFSTAVGASASGVWYPGALDVDEIHSTELGATMLVMQALTDLPEIMQYGLVEFTTTLEDTVGDN